MTRPEHYGPKVDDDMLEDDHSQARAANRSTKQEAKAKPKGSGKMSNDTINEFRQLEADFAEWVTQCTWVCSMCPQKKRHKTTRFDIFLLFAYSQMTNGKRIELVSL